MTNQRHIGKISKVTVSKLSRISNHPLRIKMPRPISSNPSKFACFKIVRLKKLFSHGDLFLDFEKENTVKMIVRKVCTAIEERDINLVNKHI